MTRFIRFTLLGLLAQITAPACAPEAASEPTTATAEKVVVLIDTSDHHVTALEELRAQYRTSGGRLLISGSPDETAAGLAQRLPWLLQPGVDVLYYDEKLAGPAGWDSLRAALDRLRHPAQLRRLPRD